MHPDTLRVENHNFLPEDGRRMHTENNAVTAGYMSPQ